MSNFVQNLETALQQKGNLTIAAGQKAYMRNRFEFYGLKANERRLIQRPFLTKENLPIKDDLPGIINELWAKPQRDFQLIGQELVAKYKKQWSHEDMVLFEYMITNKSWWDTVDYISVNLVGANLKSFSESRYKYVNKWLASDNIWLQRTALLFQLKYKIQLDTELLSFTINKLLGSNEFFINKAIGWVLREYGKTNPLWVQSFVKATKLNPLSEREALRIIRSKL